MLSTSQSGMDVRAKNRASVMRMVAYERVVSRTTLAKKTALKPPTVTRIIRELVDAGLVEEADTIKAHNRPGRRQTEIRVRPQGAFVLGFALNASGIMVALAGLDGAIIDKRRIKGASRLSHTKTLEGLVKAAENLIRIHVPDRKRLVAGAVACAGEVDGQSGHLRYSLSLGWQDVSVGPYLAAALGVPIQVLNLNLALLDATAQSDPGEDARNALLVRVANGVIGGAIRQNGRLLDTPHARSSWFGHHPARGARGKCFCGESGCLLTVASAPAMIAQYEGRSDSGAFAASEFIRNEAQIRRLLMLAKSGHKEAGRVVRKAGRALGRFLIPFVSQFGAEKVFVAGFVGRSSTYFEATQAGFLQHSQPGWGMQTSIVAASTTPTQAAVRVALKRFVYSPLLNLKRFANEPNSHSHLAASSGARSSGSERIATW